MNQKKNTKEYPAYILREELRQMAAEYSLSLSRSVNRLTSYDHQPCMEYQEEVQAEYEIVDRLLYAQQCRAALERCLGRGASRLRYQWRDGAVSETSFRRITSSRVRVCGLVLEEKTRSA